jgi:capsular polysaccharide biosynthesis protein
MATDMTQVTLASPVGSGADRSLRLYARFVRRHAVLMCSCVILGVAVANTLIRDTAPVYRATTRVVVSLLPTGTETVGQNVSVDSDAQVLTSTRVLQAATENTAYPGGAEGLREHTIVRALPNSRVLELLVSDTSPTRAQGAASAIAREFLRIRQATADSRLEESRATLQARIDDLSAQIASVLRVAPAGQEGRTQLVGEHRDLLTELDELQRASAELSSKYTAAGFVAEPATLRDDGYRPAVESARGTGGLIGLLVALIIGWVFDKQSTAAGERGPDGVSPDRTRRGRRN